MQFISQQGEKKERRKKNPHLLQLDWFEEKRGCLEGA